MEITLIAAASSNRVIGQENRLPWHLPRDLQFFKTTTMGHHLLMGRKTWESFGKPLPGRTSMVVTNDLKLPVPEGVLLFNSITEAIQQAHTRGETELMVIGGGQIFEQTLPFASKLYLTRVFTTVADKAVRFPVIRQNEWQIVSSEYVVKDEKNPFDVEFMVLVRTQPGERKLSFI